MKKKLKNENNSGKTNKKKLEKKSGILKKN